MSSSETARCVDGQAVVGGFTLEQTAALRELGMALVHDMAGTPLDVVRVVGNVLHGDLGDLSPALQSIVAVLDSERAGDGRTQVNAPGSDEPERFVDGAWSFGPDEPHACQLQPVLLPDGLSALRCCGFAIRARRANTSPACSDG